jgi:outer membrane protein assembly factor BamD
MRALSRQGTLPAGLVLALTVVLAASGCGPKRQEEPLTPEETYRKAEAYMEARKYAKAATWFERVNTARSPELRAQVHLRLADSYFERKNIMNLAEAQSRYRSFLNAFPLSDQAAYAQYKMAVCLQRQISPPERDQSATARAMAEFRKVQQLYPNSPWVSEARRAMAELEDHLAEDALRKARFYYTRKSYPAAVSRFKEILEDNPDWPGRDEVLFYLGKALHRDEKAAEGDQYLQQLLDEFPESKYRSKAGRMLAGS